MSPRHIPLSALVALALLAGPAGRGEAPPAGKRTPGQDRAARTDRYGDPLPPGAIARMGTLRFRHEDFGHSLAFSPDGKLLAVTTADATVVLWDSSTGKEYRRLQPLPGRFYQGAPASIDFSPDSRTLIAGYHDGTLRLWDVSTGKTRLALTAATRGEPEFGRQTRFSPDGKRFATVAGDRTLVYDARTGKEVFRLGGHRASVNSLAFSPDGKTLASGTLHPAVQLWDAGNGKLLRGIEGHGDHFVYAVAFSHDSRVLASGSWDRVVLTEAATGKELGKLRAAKMEAVNGLAFTPDGKTLISASQDGKVRFWDVAGRKERLRLDARMAPIEGLALSRDGRTVAVGSYFNVVRLWDVATGKELFQDLQGHGGRIESVAFAPDGKTLAVAGDSGEVILWDPATGRPRREFPVYRPRQVAFSPDGRKLAVTGFSTSFQVRDSATGRELLRLRRPKKAGGTDLAQCVVFSPDGRSLVSAHHLMGGAGPLTGSLDVWDPDTGKRLREFPLRTAHPQALAFAPGGRRVAVGTLDGTIRLWDLQAGVEVLALRGHGHVVQCVAFSPDGHTLASGSFDQTVRLWEVATGQQVLTLTGHKRAISSVAFSPDGRVVASGGGAEHYPIQTSAPHKVRLWDVATGQELPPLQGHGCDITCLAFAPDGRTLASGLQNSTALIWEVPPAPPTPRLGPEDLGRLWSDLAGEDVRKAHAAIWALAAAPGKAVPFLRGRLRPMPAPDVRRLRRLVADLDSDQFAVRRAALKELEGLGGESAPALRQALAGKPSLEVRKRLEELLSRATALRPGEALRGVRAVEALEHAGTPEAGQVLETLSRGSPDARLTREAKAALQRLARRPAPKP